MRQFFEPAEAPLWLKRVLFSIRDGLSDIWATALRLKDYATASLPPAADWKQGLVYDSTLSAPHYSNGTSWVRLSDYDADVAAIAALSTTGLIARTGAGTAATRTVTGPAAGITVTDGDGVAGNPTLGLANDLAALEGLGSTGIAVRTAADTWAQRTVTGTANQITVTDGDGVAGNPTLALANPLTTPGATTVSGKLDATGSINGAGGLRATGSDSGGWAGNGLELYVFGAATYATSLNRTDSTYIPAHINASEVRLQASGTTTATVSSAGLSVTGDITASGVFKVGANQVLGARKTGWAAATGTATRTTFDTTTVTTAQLAERVKALLDDLISHGAIGA